MKSYFLMRSLTFIVVATSAVAQPTVVMNVAPTKVLGQAKPNVLTGGPNLVEGRELYGPQAVWLDVASATSILYVADSRNNRVLAWKNSATAGAGAPADLVIGQRDFLSTSAQGPDPSNTRLSSGLDRPSAVITDSVGNLYVADSGNNRILRFPKPFSQNAELLQVDLVIGQRSINENLFNQGAGVQGMSETSLFLSQPFAAVSRGAMAFDQQRNLWVVDPQNHRVLRYPAAAIDRGGFAPAADLVLGGSDFTSSLGRNIPPYFTDPQVRKDYLYVPSGIAFDSRGRLFVRDWTPGFSRVLVFEAPFTNGKFASRIVGIPSLPTGGGNLPPINEFVAGAFAIGDVQGARPGIFVFNNNLYVPDVSSNRILIFDPFESWPAEATRISPPARAVIGQDTFNVGRANRNGQAIGPNGFSYPVSVWVGGAEMYVADLVNNRILVMPGRDFGFNAASRVIGQTRFDQGGANLVEGKEFYFLDGFTGGDRTAVGNTLGGTCVALDGDRLYVADSQNNRVMAFADVRRIKPLDSANLVIGQADLSGTVANAPTGDAGSTSERGLNAPTCVAVDKDGNLWVADTGNGRVLRFPKPFDQAGTGLKQPNLVLGQGSFTARSTDPTSRTMRSPTGIAFLTDGSVLVSDYTHNRVLRFRKPAGGDFQNGQAADGVFGQANFTDSARGVGALNRLASPKGIATDSDDRLYVAEVLGNRVTVFSEAGTSAANATARQDFSGLGAPQAVYVNPQSGDIWVADTHSQRIVRLLPFSQLPVGTISPEQSLQSPFPLAMALDRFGNLITADAINRVTFYYPGIRILNSAAAHRVQVAPNTYSAIYGAANAFGEVTKLFTEEPNPVPMPTVVADTRVLVGEKAAPIQFVSPSQINFIVPKDTATSGTVEVIVERVSTGQVLAAGSAEMDVVAPAVFAGAGGRGQVAATNQDFSINSPSNPAARGSIITIYATGLGNLAGSPPDGVPTPGTVSTVGTLQVIIGTAAVPAANIQYSGLAPGLISVWQINVVIPGTVPPGNATPFGLRFRDTAAQPGLTIAVKQ